MHQKPLNLVEGYEKSHIPSRRSIENPTSRGFSSSTTRMLP